ncbi:MAG: class I SAM-dependent methyltransferase [Paludibacteraceae bacterium]|nr:class I SAM-dependent methyltransferase [Paludibacteraceae bacterium]
MNNELANQYWRLKSLSSPSPLASKLNKANDFSQYDADFIMKYANSNTSVLDLASGTGLAINKYYQKVKKIVAVEKYEQFSKFITQANNIIVHNTDIISFDTEEKFDIINMFGIIQYFNATEIASIYKKYRGKLKSGGKALIKGQFGTETDVTIEGFSKELNTNYYSEYRTIKKECSLLKEAGFSKIEVVDIYPASCNRWTNTHFYALVAEA